MRLLLRLSVIIFSLFSGLHVVAMLSMDAMASPGMVMSLSGEHSSTSCAEGCIANEHSFGTMSAPKQDQFLLLALALFAVAGAVWLIVNGIGSPGLSYAVRPPDLILLYGHFRI